MTALRQEDDAPRGFVPKAELYRALQRIDELEAQLAAIRGQGDAEAQEGYEALLRFAIPCSPQASRIFADLLRSKRLVHHRQDLAERYEMTDVNQVSVLIWKLNHDALMAGGPRLAGGRRGSGGIMLQPGAREWVAQRIEEFKGASK